MSVARDAHVVQKPNHDWTGKAEALGVKRPLAVLEDLGAVLEEQHRRAADGADVDRLEGCIENKDPAGRTTALLRPTGARQRAQRAWFGVTCPG